MLRSRCKVTPTFYVGSFHDVPFYGVVSSLLFLAVCAGRATLRLTELCFYTGLQGWVVSAFGCQRSASQGCASTLLFYDKSSSGDASVEGVVLHPARQHNLLDLPLFDAPYDGVVDTHFDIPCRAWKFHLLGNILQANVFGRTVYGDQVDGFLSPLVLSDVDYLLTKAS